MNKSIFTLLAAATALSVTAQSKFDISALSVMREYHQLQQPAAAHARTSVVARDAREQAASTGRITMLLLLNDGATREALEGAGCEVIDLGTNTAIVQCAIADAERLAALDCVRQISFGGKQTPHMLTTRNETGVTSIHDAEQATAIGLQQPYTGAGVLAGIIDRGFDPNHLNFLDADGNTRVEQFYHMTGTQGEHTVYTAENIADLQTDYRTDTHGTHTLGIVAGSYRGPIGYYDPREGEMDDVPNPFYGIAPGSTIAASGGELYDPNIAMGLYRLTNYRKKADKPMVINMSFGSNLGPHDGTSALCQQISRYANDGAILVMSAGNEGDGKIAARKKFTSSDNKMRTMLRLIDPNGNLGHAAFYSDDNTPFTLSLAIVDNYGNIRYSYTLEPDSDPYQMKGIATSYFDDPNYTYDKVIDNSFTAGSYAVGYGGIDAASGRYFIDIQFQLVTKSDSGANLAFIIDGEDGQEIWAYTSSTDYEFASNGISEWTDGITNGSISDLATSDNVIVVGAYSATDSYWTYNGDEVRYTGVLDKGERTYFSSYGDIIDGRTLPHVVAPGALVISSMNRYYGVSKFDADAGKTYNPGGDACSAMVNNGKSLYCWEQMSGTSMAAPVVSGTIALWLEANPRLTTQEIINEILPETCIRDRFVNSADDPAKWGYGKLDAVKGLKKALELSGVCNPVAPGTSDDMRLIIGADGSTFDIFVNGEDALTASLVNLNGITVATASSDSNSVALDTAGITPGIYVLAVKGHDTTYTRKVNVR